MVEAKLGRWNGRDDIPSVDKAIGCRPERSVIPGDEIRPADARRAEDEDLSTIETLFASCSVHRHQCDRSAETMAHHEQGRFSSMHRSIAAPTSGQTAAAAS